MTNLDNYCGLPCGACSVRLYGATGRTDVFTDCLRSVPKEELHCGGCKSNSTYTGCRVCPIKDCAVGKGHSHCIDCSQYPCRLYNRWRAGARFLPHLQEVTASLQQIKSIGMEDWFVRQEKRWACPACGEAFSWYSSACGSCGNTQKMRTYTLRSYRKLLCRLILLNVYRRAKRILIRGGRSE